MRKTEKRKWRILYPLFFVVFFAVVVSYIVFLRPSSGGIEVRTYPVPEGWGYKILVMGKVYIDQPFIPVIQGRVPFPDRISARRAGKMVKQKLLHHKQPVLTRDDIHNLGLENQENKNGIK
jgi:hypothetical protein